MHEMLQTTMHNMFHLQLPWLEKIVRPWIVYLVLIVFLRVFGKRELAQLNPFDLVVLLSLSNTVQNAIIGDDNSVTGGVVGAFSLLAINWVLMKMLYKSPKITEVLEGDKTWLIRGGEVDLKAMGKESLTHEELISVLNKNGFTDVCDVEECVLEPNGTFFVKGKTPSTGDVQSEALMEAVERLTQEVRELRAELKARA